MQMKRLGMLVGQATYQSENGPLTYTAQPGEGVVAYLVPNWKESYHSQLANVGPSTLSDHEMKLVELMRELEADLANDGKISAEEAKTLFLKAFSLESTANAVKHVMTNVFDVFRPSK